MKTYSVKQLAKLSGVSVRTLHHYDQLDLLRPSIRTESRYRYYGERELIRLQQILFYKELDFSLQDIQRLLSDPEWELVQTLESHRQALEARQARIVTLLQTIDKTILKLKAKIPMEDHELYQGLAPEAAAAYRREAIEQYGEEAVVHSENALKKRGKEDFKQLLAEHEQLRDQLRQMMQLAPSAAAVQQLIQKHYLIIRQLWGTEHAKDPQAEAYKGLGQLYLSDERFTAQNGQADPSFALFLSKAMAYFVDHALAKGN